MTSLTRFLILLILLACPALGQVTQRNLLSGRYTLETIRRDLLAKKDWKPYPKTAAEWKGQVPQNVLNELVKKGEETSKKEIPQVSATLTLEYVRTGDRSNYQAVSFARRSQLMDLVLAENSEDKGRFTDQIANYVWAICEETYWGVPAHLSVQKARSGLPDASDPTVDLFGAETAAVLALTDYFTGEKLDKVSPLLRKRIYAEANSKIFEPIKQPRYSWLDPAKHVNNWNPWIMSNMIAANLLLETDEQKRAENIHQYIKWLDIYLNGLGEDGGCDEGPSYWFAAGGSVFDSLELLQNATAGRINIYDEPFIKKMASYVYKMHIADDYFVDFADADPKFNGDGLMLYRFGTDIKDETLAQFGLYLYSRSKMSGEGFQRPRRLSNLLTIKDLPKYENGYTPTKEAWFSDIQVLTARTDNGLFLATHAGHNNESHNHNDVGDLIVYLGNEPVIIDAGRGNYTAKTFSSKRYELWFTQSQYHNLPIINGLGQLAGRQYAGENVKYSSTENETSLSMNIAAAYPKEAGVETWNRTVSLVRPKNTVEIADSYMLARAPTSLQQIFMTVCDVDLTESGKIKLATAAGKKVSLTYDAKIWTVAIDHPSMKGPEYSSFVSKWNKRPISRIVLTNKDLKVNASFQYVVSVL